MSSCSVRVVGRFRPMNAREQSEGGEGVSIQYLEGRRVDIEYEFQKYSFTFDNVFPPNSVQREVFEITARPVVQDVLNGINGTIFAYGQTGAGKTFTMMGDRNDEHFAGIIPRTCAEIFGRITRDSSGSEYTIKCSFLEIYQEKIHDLLNPVKLDLPIHESPTRGVYVADLTEEFVTCEADIFELLTEGELHRKVSATDMNARSSRSHTVFTLYIEQRDPEGAVRRGKLNLVDLAGSERLSKTGAEGQTKEEAKKINASLSALGQCIKALTEGGRKHIPYRNSRLTRILQESLGGNTKTTLVCACSPHVFNIEETISTLQFGQRAKTIKNLVKINAQLSAEQLMKLVEQLKSELSSSKKYSAFLEKQIAWMKSSAYSPSAPLPPDLLAELDSVSLESSSSIYSDSSMHTESNGSLDESGDEGDVRVNRVELEVEKFAATAELRAQMEQMETSLRTQLANLESDLSESRQREQEYLRDMEDLTKQIDESEEEMQILLEDLELEKESRKGDKEKFEFDLAQFQSEQERLRIEKNDAEELREEAFQLLEENEEKFSHLSQQLRDSEREIDRLQSELEVTFEELAVAEQKISVKEDRLLDLQSELEKTRENAHDANKEREDLYELVSQLELSVQEEQKDKIEVQRKLELAQNEAKAADERLSSARNELNSLNERFHRLDVEKNSLQREARSYVARLEELATAQKIESELCNRLREQVSQVQRECEILNQRALEAEQRKLFEAERADTLQVEVEDLRNQVTELSAQSKSLEIEKTQTETLLDQETNKVASLTEQLERNQNDIRRLHEDIALKDNVVGGLSDPVAEEKRKQQLQKLQDTIAEEEAKNRKLQTELRASISEVEKARRSEESARKQVESLESKLSMQSTRLNELEEKLTKFLEMKREVEDMRKEKEVLVTKVADLEGRLKDTEELATAMSIRRAKLKKVVTYDTWQNAMEEHSSFGQHLLKRAPSRFVDEAIKEALRIEGEIKDSDDVEVTRTAHGIQIEHFEDEEDTNGRPSSSSRR